MSPPRAHEALAPPPEGSVEPPRLRVLSLNLWHRDGPWSSRLAALHRELARVEPDVLGLQEVLHTEDPSLGPSQLDELARPELPHRAFAGAHRTSSGLELGNAIVSRYPITHAETLALPACGKGPRVVAFARIATPAGTLPFFVTHLHYRADDGFVREQQALELARLVDEKASGAGLLPAVVTGDFNAPPEAAEMRFLRGLQSLEGRSVRFFDAFEHAGRGPGVTFDEEHNPFASVWPDRPARIDYVLVRRVDERGRGRPLRAEVCFDRAGDDGVFPSDHYGVVADLAM